MNKIFVIAVTSASLLVASCGTNPESAKDTLQEPSAPSTSSVDHSSMTSSGHAMMQVSSEQDFLVQMVAHHREAVMSSAELLRKSPQNEDIRNFASNVIIEQEKEIVSMETWHQEWFGRVLRPAVDYMPMMRPLEALTLEEAVKYYLEDMIVHHEGAVVMAKQVLAMTERSELRELAQNIINAQTGEIATMKTWLQTL